MTSVWPSATAICRPATSACWVPPATRPHLAVRRSTGLPQEAARKIDKLLFGGASTISLGYAGLYECVKYMTGKSHTDAGAKPFALSVMQHMNDKCNEWERPRT